jgi:hypothetical protein
VPLNPLFVKELSSPRDKKSLKINQQKTLESVEFSRVFFVLLFVWNCGNLEGYDTYMTHI